MTQMNLYYICIKFDTKKRTLLRSSADSELKSHVRLCSASETSLFQKNVHQLAVIFHYFFSLLVVSKLCKTFQTIFLQQHSEEKASVFRTFQQRSSIRGSWMKPLLYSYPIRGSSTLTLDGECCKRLKEQQSGWYSYSYVTFSSAVMSFCPTSLQPHNDAFVIDKSLLFLLSSASLQWKKLWESDLLLNQSRRCLVL